MKCLCPAVLLPPCLALPALHEGFGCGNVTEVSIGNASVPFTLERAEVSKAPKKDPIAIAIEAGDVPGGRFVTGSSLCVKVRAYLAVVA